MQWEYRFVTHASKRVQGPSVSVVDESRVEELTRLGSDGWELVAAIPITSDDLLWSVTYLLKRQGEGQPV